MVPICSAHHCGELGNLVQLMVRKDLLWGMLRYREIGRQKAQLGGPSFDPDDDRLGIDAVRAKVDGGIPQCGADWDPARAIASFEAQSLAATAGSISLGNFAGRAPRCRGRESPRYHARCGL